MITKDIPYEKDILSKTDIYTSTSTSLRLGILLAIAGGFLDAYTFICKGGVFANAQTGNIVVVGVQLAKRDYGQALAAFLPVLAFIVGFFISEIIRNYPAPSISFIKNADCIILFLEIIVLFIIGFLPDTTSDVLITTVISFVSSLQIASFRKLVDSPYCTTMCTGNLRSACQAAYIAFTKKDIKQRNKSLRYFSIVLSFVLGGCLSGILSNNIGSKSIWFVSLILMIALTLFSIDEYRFIKKYD